MTHPVEITLGTPAVPAGFDLADECTYGSITGKPAGTTICLRELRDGLILASDLCAACRRVHRELLDSVLEPDQ